MAADPHAEHVRRRHGDQIAGATSPAPRPRCHLYLRVSSPDQDLDVGPDGRPVRVKRSKEDRDHDVKRSLDTQEAEGRAHADRAGYDVVAVYREIYTSQAFWERPELARLRNAIVAGKVDVLLCLKTERLGGTSTQVSALEHLLERYGARLEFVLQEFTNDPMGRIGKTVYVEFNGLRIEGLKEQFARNKRARLEAGHSLHGPATPYGLVWADEDRHHYRFLPPESVAWNVLRGAFLDVIAGKSQNAVASALTRRRVPAPFGGATWYQRTLGLLLRNPLYCAQPVSLRYRNEFEQRRGRRVRRQTVTPTGAGPQLRAPEGRPPVTPEEFARAQTALDANAERQRVRRGSRVTAREDWHLLGGYAVCGACEEPLRAHHSGWERDPATGERRRRPSYDCKANRYGARVCAHPVSIGRDQLEREVWLRLLDVLSRPDEVERLLRGYREAGGVSEADQARYAAEAAALQQALAANEREAKNLRRAIERTEDDYSQDVLSADLAEKGKQRAGLLDDLAAAEARLAAVDEVLAHVQGFEAQAGQLLDLLGEPDALRRLFRVAVTLFRPRAKVFPKHRADPDRPWAGDGAARVEVDFPADVPGAVRALLASLPAGDGGAEEVPPGGNDQVWSFALGGSPPAGLRLAAVPGRALTLTGPA
jgi:DNA invertase Pin-like site-specific DNA recombinase